MANRCHEREKICVPPARMGSCLQFVWPTDAAPATIAAQGCQRGGKRMSHPVENIRRSVPRHPRRGHSLQSTVRIRHRADVTAVRRGTCDRTDLSHPSSTTSILSPRYPHSVPGLGGTPRMKFRVARNIANILKLAARTAESRTLRNKIGTGGSVKMPTIFVAGVASAYVVNLFVLIRR